MSRVKSTHSISLHDETCTGSEDNINQMKLKLQENPTLIHLYNNFKIPLHVAVCENHELCVQFLLSAGANVDAMDVLGNTSLHLAIYSKNVELAKILLKHGANVNYEPIEQFGDLVQAKQNYLCIASRLTWYEMVELLLQHGANTEDNLGYQSHLQSQSLLTPISIVTCEGDTQIIKLLLLYGAKTDIMHINSKSKKYTLPFLLFRSCEQPSPCKIEILKIFHVFGTNISHLEPYVNNSDYKLYQGYKSLLSHPMSLQNLSRISIYRAIRKNYILNVQNLKTILPPQIMDILNFTEI